MTPDQHERAQLELSVAHDEQRSPSPEVGEHLRTCRICDAFQADLIRLDGLLARGRFDRAASYSPPPSRSYSPPASRTGTGGWWWVAAAALIGVVVGAVMAGPGRLDTIQAHELDDRLHTASPSLSGLEAQLVVVERGWHPGVAERVYGGNLTYSAPEQLAIDLADTTQYPDDRWIPNDVLVEISDGDTRSVASAPCPMEGLPGCLEPPIEVSRQNLRPFDESVLAPLQIVGSTSFARWGGLEVIANPILDGTATIQVETTIAGADLVTAVTDRGAWREFHPTDRVVMWLDEDLLVPIRVEVFAASSPERQLWEVRHGYEDERDEPIFVISMNQVTEGPAPVDVDVAPDAQSGGFVDDPSDVPQPDLPPGFQPHRLGHRPMPDGGRIDVATWSDGRSWLMVETTDSWSESRLFGMTSAFARRIELDSGSVGYLAPDGDTFSLHADGTDVVVSGSVPGDVLMEVAASLGMMGRPVPDDWAEASVLAPEQLPEDTLVPEAEGWSILGIIEGDRTEILLTGSGSRSVLLTSQPGERLEPPVGADVTAIDVRGVRGRYDAGSGSLEWVEDGLAYSLRSDTVGRDELIQLASEMSPR